MSALLTVAAFIVVFTLVVFAAGYLVGSYPQDRRKSA